MACSLVVGADVMDAVAEGYRLNVPPRALLGAGPSAPLLAVDDPAIVVEAVKLAEDRSGDLVVRLYEARGAARAGTLTTAFEWEAAVATDLLERPQGAAVADGRTGRVEVTLRAFEIRTVRFSGVRAAGTEERT
jgi:alpha-mannosidase